MLSALEVAAWRVWQLDDAQRPVREAAAGADDGTLMQSMLLEKPRGQAVFCALHGGMARALPPNPAAWGAVALELFLPIGQVQPGVPRWRYWVMGRSSPMMRRTQQGVVDLDGDVVTAESRPGHRWGRGPAQPGYVWPLAWPLASAEPVGVAHVEADPAGRLQLRAGPVA